RLEAAGYPVVAHLHDEVVCEVPSDFGSLEEFIVLIEQPPAWAPDFPVKAKGRIADRLIEIKEPKPVDTSEELVADNEHDVDLDRDDEALDEEPLEAPPIEEQQPAFTSTESAPPPPPPLDDEEVPPRDEDDSSSRGNGRNRDGNSFAPGHGYSAGEQPRGTPTTRYIYKDARGRLFMRVTRTNGKSFPTAHWEDGRWVSGWPAGPVIPYRLPELIAASPSEPIWICEGEKDCDNVAALRLVATTNPGGAKVFQPELAQWFKGKELAYILEDNDDAGRRHTAKILAVLAGIVSEIVTVSFPELREKGDVSDWLEAGGNKKLLIARAEEARKRNEGRRGYTLIDLHTLNLEATDWLWEGHLIRGELEL